MQMLIELHSASSKGYNQSLDITKASRYARIREFQGCSAKALLLNQTIIHLHDNLIIISTCTYHTCRDETLTQSLSFGGAPTPISSKVFGPLPGVDDADDGVAGFVCCAGIDGLFACGC